MKKDVSESKSSTKTSITRNSAAALISAAHLVAAQMGIEVAVAITDIGGHLKAFEATDRVKFLATDLAVDKAWTAVSFGMATHMWGRVLKERPDVAQLAHRPRLVAVGGGYPIVDGEQIIGGFGVSGGSVADDQQIAEGALRAIGFSVPDPV
jgi:uncharacterized protein GlcG (DUF336 family)